MNLVSPYPLDSIDLIWKWYRYSKFFLNSHTSTKEEFLSYIKDVLPRSISWGVQDDQGLCGIVIFEPSYFPGAREIYDGYINLALDRRVWGQRLMNEALEVIVGQLFTLIPSLQRISAYTLMTNAPARSFAQSFGSKLEGVIRSGTVINNKPVDIACYGLTRGDFYGWTENHNYNTAESDR